MKTALLALGALALFSHLPALAQEAAPMNRAQVRRDAAAAEKAGPLRLQQAPHHLARAALGQGVGKLDDLRHLVGRHVFVRPGDDVLGLGGGAVFGTQDSCTSGHLNSIRSTSLGHTLKPLALIMRLSRSVMKK